MTLNATDDRFHPPTTDEPTWAETSWFAANIPEEDLVLWFYPMFRPQLGILSCAVYVFGPGHQEPWELPYYRPYWHMPIPADITGPCDFVLPNSLSYETLEPLRRYRLRYEDGEALKADLTFEALHDAHPLGVEQGRGHLDQFGRVTGDLVLHGRHFEVDSIEMRDRTWSPRREGRQRTRLGYSYGARPDGRGFHSSVRFSSDDESVFMTGFLLDGQTEIAVEDARREVERDDRGRPTGIRLQLRDERGEEHTIRGEVRGQMTLYTSPYAVFVSAVRWTLPDGTEAYGEDQDTWSPGRLRQYLVDHGYSRNEGSRWPTRGGRRTG